jgi:hypothetical protein
MKTVGRLDRWNRAGDGIHSGQIATAPYALLFMQAGSDFRTGCCQQRPGRKAIRQARPAPAAKTIASANPTAIPE